MRFSEVVIIVGIFCFLSTACNKCFCSYIKLCEKEMELNRQVNEIKFMTESFKNTCRGVGFSDLNEWQLTCRTMFNLEYVGWSNAEEFMDVNYENSNQVLYYGKWINKGISEDVYCRGVQSE